MSQNEKTSKKRDPGPVFLMDLGSSNSLRGVGLIQLLRNPKSKGQERRAHDKLRETHDRNKSGPHI
jgi:hypothetical protein